MTDIAFPVPAISRPWKITPLQRYLVVFAVFLILGAINLSLVKAKTERECDARPGGFSSDFSSGFQTYSCECSSPFHFAEACPTSAMILPPDFAPAI